MKRTPPPPENSSDEDQNQQGTSRHRQQRNRRNQNDQTDPIDPRLPGDLRDSRQQDESRNSPRDTRSNDDHRNTRQHSETRDSPSGTRRLDDPRESRYLDDRDSRYHDQPTDAPRETRPRIDSRDSRYRDESRHSARDTRRYDDQRDTRRQYDDNLNDNDYRGRIDFDHIDTRQPNEPRDSTPQEDGRVQNDREEMINRNQSIDERIQNAHDDTRNRNEEQEMAYTTIVDTDTTISVDPNQAESIGTDADQQDASNSQRSRRLWRPGDPDDPDLDYPERLQTRRSQEQQHSHAVHSHSKSSDPLPRKDSSDFHFEDFQFSEAGYDIYKSRYGRGLDFLETGADFEAAISATGFGRFHFCLLAITGLIYANTAIGITIVSFVLPAATCDFQMTSSDKGWLTAAPMLGMVLGSYFWGCLADTKGRKVVLVSTLLIDGIIGIISSMVQILPVFMACRFINGFSVAGAMGIVFPYLGEFQQTKYREKILCWMEMFWTLGVILLPLIAWAIIPITGIRVESGAFSYDSWNWFVSACGLPSVLLGLWLLSFPESPKFMMECGDYDDALDCLKGIYKINTGDNPDNYPIKSLKEKVRSISTTSQTSQKSVRSLSMHNPKDLKRLFGEIWSQTKALCKPPYRKYTILTCLIQFGLTTSYYTLMIWFPELFNRYEEYETRFPNTSASVCDISSIVVIDEASNDPFDCLKTIDSNVYLHTLIVGLACIPTSLWLPLCVHKLGAKFFLIFSLGVAGVVTMGLYFVNNSTQNLVLSCIFEALTSLAISLVFCVLVDLFPTNLRVMAAALSLTAGRGGGLIGNLSFGYLIDINCAVPIVVFSAFLIIAAILCFFLPKTGQEALD